MRRLAAVLAALVLTVTACGGADEPPAESGPQALPAFTLQSFDGGPTLELASVRGPALINFWASWCGFCKDEMPILERLHRKHDGLTVIGVDYLDPQVEAAVRDTERLGITYDLYADPDGQLSSRAPFPNLRGLPYTALVDADGRVVHGEFVVFEDLDQIETFVTEHLGEGALS